MGNLAASKAKVNEPAKRLQLKPYVRLPRDLLSHPPIRRRHTPKSLNYLWPFEFGIMHAVIAVGSAHWHGQLATQAFADSGQKQRQLHEEWARKRVLRFVGIETTPPFDGRRQTSREVFEDFGSRENSKSHLRRMRKGAPATVTVEASATSLLICVGLANNGDNHRRLEPALDRLLEPVADRPSVLASWEPLADKRVQLEVAGEWLYQADEMFRYLPRRLPSLRSPTVLTLFLFLRSLPWTKGNNRHNISWRGLCERVGLSLQQGVGRRQYQLNTALAELNYYLAHLSTTELKGLKGRNEVPASYDLHYIGDKVRFISRSRHLAERLEAEEYAHERQQAEAEEADDDDFDWKAWRKDIERRDAEKKQRLVEQVVEDDDDADDFEPVYRTRQKTT